MFSIFEEYTEWISKGEAGVPVELGLKVCVMLMQQQTDDQVAIPMVKQTVEKFPELNSCSFDKGFHLP
ncbi:MAG: hypothetical protein J7J70_02825 [Deltaproteobacteria bacterium]|nr:hypothetical protein [Candidatus Tharpellaceae bacterium]